MADTIVFIDGFDHYQPSTQWQYKWDAISVAPNQTTGRFGSAQSLRMTTAILLEKSFSTTSAAWRFGCAINLQAIGGSNINLISLKDGATAQCELVITTARKLRINRNGTQVGSDSANAIASSTWVYLEWYIVISDSISSGHCTVKINGSTELSVTSGDTKNTGNAFADRFVLTAGGSWDVYLDDLVVTQMDTTTTPTFLGDLRVTTLFPNGNGNYSQFVGSDSDSTNNYLLVDENSTVNLADYVESSIVSDRDSYTFEDPAVAPATVYAVQVNTIAAKSDAGSRSMKPFIRLSSTNYDGTEVFLADSATNYRHLRETSPDTSSAWSSSEINALEAGVKVQS